MHRRGATETSLTTCQFFDVIFYKVRAVSVGRNSLFAFQFILKNVAIFAVDDITVTNKANVYQQMSEYKFFTCFHFDLLLSLQNTSRLE